MSFEAAPASSFRIQIPVLTWPQRLAVGRVSRRVPTVRAVLRPQLLRGLAVVLALALVASIIGTGTGSNVVALVVVFELGVLAALVMFNLQVLAIQPRPFAIDAWPDHLTLLYDTGTLAVRGWHGMDISLTPVFLIATTTGKPLLAVPRTGLAGREEEFLAVARAGGATVAFL